MSLAELALGMGPLRRSVFRYLSANDIACVACMSTACQQAVEAEGLLPRVIPFPPAALLSVLPVRLRRALMSSWAAEWWSFNSVSNVLAVRTDAAVDVWHADGRRVTIQLDAIPNAHRLTLHGDGDWVVSHDDGDVRRAYRTVTGLVEPLLPSQPPVNPTLVRVGPHAVYARFDPSNASNASTHQSGFYDRHGVLLVPARVDPWPDRVMDRVLALSTDRLSAAILVRVGKLFVVNVFGRAASAASSSTFSLYAPDGYMCKGFSLKTDGDSCFTVHMAMRATTGGHVVVRRYVSHKDGRFDNVPVTLPEYAQAVGVCEDVVSHLTADFRHLRVFCFDRSDRPCVFTMHDYVDMHVDLLNRVVVAADIVKRTFTVFPLDAYLALQNY